mmetsp:Transcript_79977/g.222446  ORF Transcript_79977/g.222446 Transcript_79977/m.222446 type:complete len:152 (+) Transcript_79977:138-593(+)
MAVTDVDVDEEFENLTAAQLDEFRRCFEDFDVDNSGAIDADELRNLMKTFGHDPSEEEIKATLAVGDKDGNDEIEFDEFCKLLLRKRKEAEEIDGMRQAFQALDRNGDGFIDKEELAELEGLSRAEVDQIFREADTNNDGLIGYDEFLAWK